MIRKRTKHPIRLILEGADFNNSIVHCGAPEYSQPLGYAGSAANRSTKKTSHPNPPRHKGKVAAEKVLQTFNTWAFKREQPDNPLLMLQLIAHSIAAGEPIPFVLYWGKGPRSAMTRPMSNVWNTSLRLPAGSVKPIPLELQSS